MSVLNTGSWYQILFKRKTIDHYIPFPPIEHFRVTSDLLDMHIALGVENCAYFAKIPFSVTNLKPSLSMCLGVESVIDDKRVLLTVNSASERTEIVLSAENI